MKKVFSVMLAVLMTAALALSFSGCGGNSQQETKNIDLEKLHQDIKAAYGEGYTANMAIDAATLETVYGISEDLYDECIAETAMISAQTDFFIALKAKDGKSEEMKTALEKAKEAIVASAFYPANQVKVQSTQVIVHGDYGFVFVLGYPENLNEEDEEAMRAAYDAENQKAADVIESYFK